MSSGRSSLRQLQTSTAFRMAARGGYAVNGLLHILIGGLAISVALGAGGEADQSGALGALAATPGGAIILWGVVVGLVALGLWQILQTIVAYDSDTKKRWAKRAKEAGKAIAYLAIAFSAFGFARGRGGSSNEDRAEDFTAALLGSPLGRLAVLLVAAIALGVGGYFIYKGIKEKFREDLDVPAGDGGRATVLLGKVGYVAKGVSIAIVGVLFLIAGVTSDAEEAGGLDGALKSLAALPFGTVLLILVGLGLIAYGVYCFVRAKRARL